MERLTHPLEAVVDEGLEDVGYQQRDADYDEVHADDGAGVHGARGAWHGPGGVARSLALARKLTFFSLTHFTEKTGTDGGVWHDARARRRVVLCSALV